MKNVLVSLFLLLLTISCANKQNQRKDALDFIPKNTFLAFKIRNLEALKSDHKNNDLLPLLSQNEGVSYLNTSLSTLENMDTNHEIIVALNTSEANDTINYTYITRLKDSLFTSNYLHHDSINTSLFKSYSIEEKRLGNQDLFSTVIDSFFVATTLKSDLQNLIENTSKASKFDAISTLKSDASLSYYYHTNRESNDSLAIDSDKFGELVANDIDLSQSNLNFNGITKAKDSTLNFVSYISASKPQSNDIVNIIPKNSNTFTSYTFNNLNTIQLKYNTLHKSIETNNSENSELTVEIGQFAIGDKLAYVLRSIDVSPLKEELNTASNVIENFRQTEVYKLESPETITDLLSPFFRRISATHYVIIDNFIVFTKSLDDAKTVISNYSNNTTINTSEAYQSIVDDIGAESSYLHFSYSSRLDHQVAQNFPSQISHDSLEIDLKNKYAQVFQITNDHGFAHINSSIKKVKKKARTNSISEAFNLTLDSDLLNDPQVVKNHITGEKDIVVQDIENQLYLISNKGKVLWKKQINGEILGDIQQIDIYKNGRLQLVFATSNRVYVLDRHGKNVNPFPLKFNDAISQPLSVFDYDKNKKYRFLVVQGKNTIMYDAKGKTVRGFTFKSAKQNIITQPKHFRLGSKDYIVFGAGKKMHILNRKGESRISVKEAIDFSNNPILLYKNKFTATNTDGQLIQIDQRGRINKQNLLLPADHHITSTSKTLGSLADNKLTIKSKTIELDFGDYTAPKIFYLKDKIYISITDLQTQKIYVFDSQTKRLPNFPVYGTSSIVMDNIDRGKNLEFVTKGENNAVILYEMN